MDIFYLINEFNRIFWLYLEAAGKQLYTFSWYNTFMWVGIWCLFCFVLELMLPRNLDYKVVKRKGFWLDIFYVIFNDFLLMGLGFFAFMWVFEKAYLAGLGSIGIDSTVIFEIHDWPLWAQILVLFVIVDLMEFLAHYAMHRFNFLWAFHKIHHAQEEIGFASSRHFHWGEIFVFKPFIYLPLILLGYTAQEYTILVLTLVYFAAFFSHTNVRLNFGFFNYLFITPQTHQWHHAKNMPHPHRYGVNFASVLPLWDLLIGTFYLPKDKREIPELGVDDGNDMPKTFFGQFVYPFVFLLSKGKNKDNVFESSLQTEQVVANPIRQTTTSATQIRKKKPMKKRKK